MLLMGRRKVFLGPRISQRHLHVQKVNVHPGVGLYKLTNDINFREAKESYIEKSFAEFHDVLEANSFYLYVDRAKLMKNNMSRTPLLWPGHVACFKTSENRKVEDNSFVSLRNGEKSDGKVLRFRLPLTEIKSPITTYEYHAYFVPFLEEIEEYFLSRADPNFTKNSRFLISIPKRMVSCLDLGELEKNLEEMKKRKKYYVIANAEDDLGKRFSRFNCVDAVYCSLGLEGEKEAPSPQLAASSLLTYFFGEQERSKILGDSGLCDLSEMSQNDDLQKKPLNTYRRFGHA